MRAGWGIILQTTFKRVNTGPQKLFLAPNGAPAPMCGQWLQWYVRVLLLS